MKRYSLIFLAPGRCSLRDPREGEFCFSFVLRNTDQERQKATIEVVTFPEEYMNLRDRPYFDEMLSRLGTNGGGARGE